VGNTNEKGRRLYHLTATKKREKDEGNQAGGEEEEIGFPE